MGRIMNEMNTMRYGMFGKRCEKNFFYFIFLFDCCFNNHNNTQQKKEKRI